MRQITNENEYNQAIASGGDRLVVAMFESASCQFCGPIKQYGANLEAQYPNFLEIICIDNDTPANAALFGKYQITETPTFIIYYHGEQIYRLVGSNFAQLESMVMGSLF